MRSEKAVLYKIRVTAFPRFHTLFHLVIVNSYEQILLEYKNVRKITNTQFFKRKCFLPKMQTPVKKTCLYPRQSGTGLRREEMQLVNLVVRLKNKTKRGFLWTFGASTGS